MRSYQRNANRGAIASMILLAGPRAKNFQKSLKMSNPSLRMESKKAQNY